MANQNPAVVRSGYQEEPSHREIQRQTESEIHMSIQFCHAVDSNSSVTKIVCLRERGERERERQRENQREREIERVRESERVKEDERDRERIRERESERGKRTRETERESEREIERE